MVWFLLCDEFLTAPGWDNEGKWKLTVRKWQRRQCSATMMVEWRRQLRHIEKTTAAVHTYSNGDSNNENLWQWQQRGKWMAAWGSSATLVAWQQEVPFSNNTMVICDPLLQQPRDGYDTMETKMAVRGQWLLSQCAEFCFRLLSRWVRDQVLLCQCEAMFAAQRGTP